MMRTMRKKVHQWEVAKVIEAVVVVSAAAVVAVGAAAVSVAEVVEEADAAQRRIGISSSETGSTGGAGDNFRAALITRLETPFSTRGPIRSPRPQP